MIAFTHNILYLSNIKPLQSNIFKSDVSLTSIAQWIHP